MRHRALLPITLLLASCTTFDDTPGDDPVQEATSEDFATISGVGAGCRPTQTVVHGTTIAPGGEFWSAFAYHAIPNGLTVNAPLTIGPCSVVQIGGGQTITVGSGGAIVTQVDSFGNGVNFARLDPNAAWGQIKVNGGSLSFTHVTIGGGGQPTPFALPGEVVLQAASSTLTAQGLTITGSARYGLNFTSGRLGAVSGLAIYGNAGAPVFISADLVHLLPTGTYSGNSDDAIVIPAAGTNHTVVHSQTWRNLGVPYRVGDGISSGTLDVDGGSGPVAVLTLQPGTTLQFAKGNGMRISTLAQSSPPAPARGALVALGTTTAPIVFTSAATTPAPGDWDSITFNDVVDPSTVMHLAFVMYAGGEFQGIKASCGYPDVAGNTWAAIHILGPDGWEPTTEFIQGTAIAHSLHFGIDRGYHSDSPLDFKGTNTFVDIEGVCEETVPRGLLNGCPNPARCG